MSSLDQNIFSATDLQIFSFLEALTFDFLEDEFTRRLTFIQSYALVIKFQPFFLMLLYFGQQTERLIPRQEKTGVHVPVK